MTVVGKIFERKITHMKEKAIAIAEMDHSGEKGYFREHFINEVIEGMFPQHIGVGSGIIVDKEGATSGQTDVIIFDKRILPPFIANTQNSIYPLESVIAVIEVKSNIPSQEICDKICNNMEKTRKIFNGLFFLFSYNSKSDGSFGADLLDVRTKCEGKNYFPPFLAGYCILNACSNFQLFTDEEIKWVYSDRTDNLYEVKRFLAVSIDNIRSMAEAGYQKFMFKRPSEIVHKDIWGDYIRD